MWNLDNPVSRGFPADLEKVANARNVRLQFIDVREAARLDQAFQQASRTTGAAVVVCENLFLQNWERVVELAAKNRLPAMYCMSDLRARAV
jgi:hypothetical protein